MKIVLDKSEGSSKTVGSGMAQSCAGVAFGKLTA